MASLKNIAQRDLSRSSILWFSIAFVLTIIPQLFIFLPMWVAAVFTICFVWRIQIFRMKLGYPNGVVKFTIIAIIIGVLFLTKGNFLNTEGCAILFMAIYGLKFVESKTVHDGHVLAVIGFIALGTTYLFDNSAYLFLFSVLIFLTLITAIIGLQQQGYGIYSRKILLWNAIKIMGISLPLMVLLFVIFPRFPSMLPNMKQGQEKSQAQTGVSNSMEPGSIAELANSDKHILWAEFTNNVPAVRDLYWRSLTLDHFDGRAWRQSGRTQVSASPNYKIINLAGSQDYSVIFDPSFQKYLATLDISQIDFGSVNRGGQILPFSDFRVEFNRPVDTKIQYKAKYVPNVTMLSNTGGRSAIESDEQFIQATNNNPKTTELADQLRQDNPSEKEFVERLMNHFRQGGYQYTMQPGLMTSRDSIDEFMFDAKAGFCEHYASATTFMLRKANIPSRVVIGYLGGAIDQDRKLVEVRGKDAHAWVEYWDNNQGWVRIDPTSTVSPSRIDFGIDDLFAELTGMGDSSVWDQFKLSFESIKDRIDYQWTKMVLGYQSDSQQSLLKNLFKIDFISVFTLVKISIGLLFTFVLVQTIIFFKPWRHLYFNAEREYFRVIELANQTYGLKLPISTAPVEFAHRLNKYLPEDDQVKVTMMMNALVAHWYQPNATVSSMKHVKVAIFAVQKLLKGKNVRK